MDENERTDKSSSSRRRPPRSDRTHTESGAPTDKAHEQAGDGTLSGSIPAGLTPDELRKTAEEEISVEPGTG